MSDLYNFYRSSKWRNLLDQIKLERLNSDGQLICEYCGKPITRAFDIIGHHKEHLTIENVNDVSISLNPNNIALVHHRCHNYIHEKLSYRQREVFIVYGSPLSGKTSWVKENAESGDLIVDIDNIWECVSGRSRYEKPGRLKAVVFRLRDDLIECVKYRVGKWNNAYIVGGYPLISERERLAKDLGAREILIECDKEECIKRLHDLDESDDRKKNVEAWLGYIDEWFDRYTPPG